jgi:hypothetical protein
MCIFLLMNFIKLAYLTTSKQVGQKNDHLGQIGILSQDRQRCFSKMGHPMVPTCLPLLHTNHHAIYLFIT